MQDLPEPAVDPTEHRTNEVFSAVAQWASRQCGRASTFIIASGAMIVWAITGPMFNYSDTWQLVINTVTSIVTFLMVFLIQNTQNRDMSMLHLKLDELIRLNRDARSKLLKLEEMTEAELDQLKATFFGHATVRAGPSAAGTAVGGADQTGEDVASTRRDLTEKA
jgi:low affinity Fe/Cu permease